MKSCLIADDHVLMRDALAGTVRLAWPAAAIVEVGDFASAWAAAARHPRGGDRRPDDARGDPARRDPGPARRVARHRGPRRHRDRRRPADDGPARPRHRRFRRQDGERRGDRGGAAPGSPPAAATCPPASPTSPPPASPRPPRPPARHCPSASSPSFASPPAACRTRRSPRRSTSRRRRSRPISPASRRSSARRTGPTRRPARGTCCRRSPTAAFLQHRTAAVRACPASAGRRRNRNLTRRRPKMRVVSSTEADASYKTNPTRLTATVRHPSSRGGTAGRSRPSRQRRLARLSPATERTPISFMSRSISARSRPRMRSTPGWPAAASA